MKPHTNLELWQQAMVLVQMVYEATSGFPREELFGLTNQMRRAAVSVPSNIAEGAGRGGEKEFLHFLNIAQGSLSELDTQIEIAGMLNFLRTDELLNQSDRVGRLLTGLIKKLRIKTP
jgi:four helix bundle protein